MRSVLFPVLLCCFVLTIATKSRSVNVALETSLLFEPGEDNSSFIDKIRKFIDQIEKAITPVKAFLRTTIEEEETFTEFLRKMITAVLKYDNKDLKEAINLLTNEVEILFDDIDIFSEDTREIILDFLMNHSKMKPNVIRSNLHNILNSNDSLLYDLFVKLNNNFNDSDKAKLDDVLKKFAIEKGNLKDIVKRFIHIIKDKYENLSSTDRNRVDKVVHKICNQFDDKLVNIEDVNEKKDRKLEIVRDNSTGSNILNKPEDIFINTDVEVSIRGAKVIDEENYSIDKDVKFNILEDDNVELSAVEEDFNGS